MQRSLKAKRSGVRLPAVVILFGLTAVALTLARYASHDRARASPYAYPYQTTTVEATQRKLEGDIAFYQTRVNANPRDGLELAALAGAYLKKARTSGWATWYLLAEQAARRSLANLPVFNTPARLVLAEVTAARHDFDEAVRLAAEVLASQRGHEGASAILVTSRLARGEVASAHTVAAALARGVPSSGSLGLLALTETARGQDEAAETHFQAAIRLEDVGDAYGSAWLRVQLGKLKARHGGYAEADALYREALRIVPDLPLALLSDADLDLARGRYRAAERRFHRVLAHSEDSSTVFDHAALQGLAQSQTLRGEDATASWSEAEALLRQDVFTGTFGHRRELARLLLSRGRPTDNAEALALLEAELHNRQDVQTLGLYAFALERAGRFADAEGVVQRALATGFQVAGLFYRAGSVQDELGRPERALDFYRQARALDPHFDLAARQRLERGVWAGP